MKYRGSISLTTVIVLGAILLLSGISLTFSSIDLSLSTRNFFNLQLARLSAQSCTEEVLLRLSDQPTLLGSVSLNITGNDCSAQISDGATNGTKVVQIQSNYNEYSYQEVISVDVSTSPIDVID